MAGTETRLPRAAAALAATAAVLLAGCASVSPDGAIGPVAQHVQHALGPAGNGLQALRTAQDIEAAERRVGELLALPLTQDSAVQVALINHRGLQARLQALGVADAELAMLGRLPNPGFSFGRSRRGDEREIERGLHFNLAALLLRPLAHQVESRRLEGLQRQVAVEVLAHIAETRKAWVRAVAAEQTLRYMQQVHSAADAGAELARRMAQAGNFSRLQRAREHGFYAEAALNLARAQHAQVASRERLNRQLGLWGAQTQYTLPERLPDLLDTPPQRPDIEREAMTTRLDLQAAQQMVAASARNLGLTRATRFVSVLEFAVMRNSSNEAPVKTGWEIDFQIPLFDWGTARVAQAQAVYMQQVHLAAHTAVTARSEVREAWHAMRTAHDLARHYRDEIVPAARLVSDENLLRYNGMFIGVFDLLADARSQVAAVNESIGALRDFWLAQADLELALVGRPGLQDMGVPALNGGAGGGKEH